MKVLHIWNTAGVAGFIAKAMDENHPTESKVLMRAACDPYKCTIKGKNYEDRAAVFVARALAHIPFYDIIHVHGLDWLIKWIKLAIPWKPLFLHYHGTNIRGLWEKRRKHWRWADEIFVSTPDLCAGAPSKVIWIPNVVNETLCELTARHAPQIQCKYAEAFSDSRWAENEAEDLARKHDYRVEFGHRTFTEGIDHSDYLAELVCFPAYIDVKRDFPGYGDGEIIEAHSLTGLEALFMGLEVIRWDGELVEDFPEHHEARFVVKKLYEIYRRYTQ